MTNSFNKIAALYEKQGKFSVDDVLDGAAGFSCAGIWGSIVSFTGTPVC